MGILWEVLFKAANRRLRRLGVLGALCGLLLALYVEIPVEVAGVQSEFQRIERSMLSTIRSNEQAAAHGAHRLRVHR
jgi:hypothetical protein